MSLLGLTVYPEDVRRCSLSLPSMREKSQGVQKKSGVFIQEKGILKPPETSISHPIEVHVKKEILLGCPLYLQESSVEEWLPGCHVPTRLSSIPVGVNAHLCTTAYAVDIKMDGWREDMVTNSSCLELHLQHGGEH